MAKKIIGLFLVLLLLACMPALAEEPLWSYDSGNMYLQPDGELSGDVTIPAEVDGYPVNAIKYNSFNSNNAVTSLTMPDTLRAIQGGAISWMDGLTSVTLNDGLEYLGSIFHNCNALTSLTIPASVRIVDGAINSCASLKEITFEGACPIFLNTDWCFDGLSEDYVIYVPDDQLDAYASALADANGAADHLQPSGKNAVIPKGENIEDWFQFDAATCTITGYQEWHAYIEIPSSIGGVAVKAIGEKAFRSDYSIYGIVFPEGMERIGAAAFQYASNLAYAKFPSTLRTIADSAFCNAQIDQIIWSEGLEEIGACAFQYDRASVLHLPTTVQTIGERAFEGSWCQELYLSGNVESIGPRAFAKTSLNYMAFDLYAPIDIAPDAFVETCLADLDLPWDSTFENRDAYAEMLKDQCPDCTVWINNPDSAGVAEYPINKSEITTIENGVWTGYNGDQADLTVWTAYDEINVTALGDGLFKGNQSIRSFYPHHCGWFNTIGNEAFADSSVEFVELFGSITTIGDEAFRNCENITELTLPESLTSIGAGAFKGCTGITEMTLPASLTSIGEGALDGCERLAKLTVLCDPAILPENLLAECFAHIEMIAAPDATDAQVALLSALAQRPWYAPVSRVGEPVHDLTEMPYAMLPIDDFWYDTEYARLDAYQGYELNLVLPREAEGVQLTMIGGNMMKRACYGDNFDVELPVVSLVIPENYTDIGMYAFQNCNTLETVICYAPIENLPEGCFSGCTSLREVIFVTGVRNIDRYVFDNCPNLQTVYLGGYVENVSEYAFLNLDGSEAFSFADCITDPALIPDVDALLAAVERAPMPSPTPEPTPEPAEPVGAEGEPFLGEWHGVSMEMEGMTLKFSDIGMEMTLTFNEDGTATLFDGEETETTTWKVEDGKAVVDTMQASMQDDGMLCIADEETKMIFSREGETGGMKTVTPAPAQPVDAEAKDYLGTWQGASMEMEGATISFATFGMSMTLTFNEDGTMVMSDGEESEMCTWTVEDGAAVIDTMRASILEDGTLCIEQDGVKMIFSRGGGTEKPELTPDPLPEPTPEPTSESATSSARDVPAQERLERKYVCINADVSGVRIDASMLGGEYSMTFHANGTMDFVMVGTLIPNLNWTQGEGVYVIDYYGTPMEAALTEEGFDLNYFDSMLMHFTAEKE